MEITSQLPVRGTTAGIIRFPSWVPYAIAACLMILEIFQVRQIMEMKSVLQVTRAHEDQLWRSNRLENLRLVTLEARDTSYASSKILVAWTPYRNEGVVSLQNCPAPPGGHDYQLWVLDPAAEAPLNAGLITPETGSQRFAVKAVNTPGPGFAISLEPTGGSPEPTGPILFAVAPGQ